MKKKLYSLLVMLVAMFALTACGEDKNSAAITETRLYEDAAGKTYTVENESLKLELDGDTTTFALKNKKTGEVWYSNPSDLAKHPAEGKNKNILQSTLLVQYSNKTDNRVDIDNYSKSIKNKNYTIEEVKGGLKVNYTIGEVGKLYKCPPAATESRMNEFLTKMDESSQKLIKRNYVYYNYDDLSGTELDDAESKFPDIKKEPVYELRENITDSFAKQIEDAFAKVGYTDEDYKKDASTFEIQESKQKPVFNVSVYYMLEGTEFVVKVPMEEIQYRSIYPIVEISVLPYMGAGSTEDQGYVLIPDGVGGIINFNNGKTGQQTYTSDMYGWDYGISRMMVVDETKSNFPMFAIAKNGTSMICASEEGSAYSIVRADISGKGNDYNYGRFAYNLIHGETMDISSKSDTTVRIFESSLPKENITQRYMFSNTDDYVKLASTYRNYLFSRYPELQKQEKSNLSMTVEMLGAVDNIEHILGFPITKSQALTTYKEAKDILSELVDAGVNPENMNAKYSGWFNTGTNQTTANKMKLVSRLGSKSDLKDLASFASSKQIDLFMDGSFNYVLKDKALDGFMENRDAAKYVSREIAEVYGIWAVTFKPDKDNNKSSNYFLTKPGYAKTSLENFVKTISDYGTKNVSLQDYGRKLAGDYNPKNRVSREANMNMQMNSMSTLKSSGSKLMINEGNQYAVPYADVVTNINFNNKKINLIDEAVPFYTIALHGVVNYTGDAINLAEDYETNMLKSVETGAGLYFVFMEQPTSVLQKGWSTQYFACNFDEWKADAVQTYERFNKELSDIYNQYIVEHKKLANGVYLTKYESGKTTVVNYNYNNYNYNGKTIPKRDFITIGGGQ